MDQMSKKSKSSQLVPNISLTTHVTMLRKDFQIDQTVKTMPGMTIFNTGTKKLILSRKNANDKFQMHEFDLPDERKRKSSYKQLVFIKSNYKVKFKFRKRKFYKLEKKKTFLEEL
jgi:hypothetical protein